MSFKKLSQVRKSRLGWILLEIAPASLLLVATLLFVWMWFGIKPHKLVIVHGEFASYGHVQLTELVYPKTQVLEFTAVRLPARALTWSVLGQPLLVWPISETVQVTVRYRDGRGRDRLWENDYIVACESDGNACYPLTVLAGVTLYGRDTSGESRPEGVKIFQDTVPVQEKAKAAQPPAIVPVPQKSPAPENFPVKIVSAPRLFIRRGLFYWP